MLDKEAIREAADIQVVAEEIGIPIQLGKKNPMILCPCHDDEHFGSCYLDLKRNTFKCYSCGAHGDVFALVQAAMGVSFARAKEIVAEICGGSTQFKIQPGDETDIAYSGMIPRVDQEFIGLQNTPVYVSSGFYNSLEEIDDEERAQAETIYDKDNYVVGYCTTRKAASNPLYTLMKDDPEMYRFMIDSFCENTIERYQRVITLFHRPGISETALGRFVEDVNKYGLYDEIVKYVSSAVKRAQRISVKYGNGNAVKAEASADIERLSALANSIWAKDKEAPF